jgi:hypothetical protein
MSPSLAACRAAAYSLVSSFSTDDLASQFAADPGEISLALERAPLTWRQRLASALSDPEFRPELLPHLVALARLEEQYRGADAICRRTNSHSQTLHNAEEIDCATRLKADMLALRAQQHVARLLKEIDLAEKRYQKALLDPDADEAASDDAPAERASKSACPAARRGRAPACRRTENGGETGAASCARGDKSCSEPASAQFLSAETPSSDAPTPEVPTAPQKSPLQSPSQGRAHPPESSDPPPPSPEASASVEHCSNSPPRGT